MGILKIEVSITSAGKPALVFNTGDVSGSKEINDSLIYEAWRIYNENKDRIINEYDNLMIKTSKFRKWFDETTRKNRI